MRLNVLIHILQDGTVESVRMLGSSDHGEWDSLALQCIREWRYAPFRRDGVPVDIWFRQLVVLQIQEPIVLTIGELVSSTPHEADSLYALLEKGTDLDSLSAGPSVHLISQIPENARTATRKLGSGEYTSPLRRGEQYVIYKRFDRSKF